MGTTVELTNNQASILSNFHAVKREMPIWWAVHIVNPDLLLLRANVYSNDLSLAASVNSDLFGRCVVDFQFQYATFVSLL